MPAEIDREPARWHSVTQLLHVVKAPVAGQALRSVERFVIIEKTNPERRQGADAPPRAAIGTAHFQKTLHAHVGEERGEVVGPVAHRWHAVRYAVLQCSCHELPECDMRAVVIAVVAYDEIHRHVQRPLHIITKAERVGEGKWQEARTLVVRVAPDLAAPRLIAVKLPFREGRVREKSGRKRL